MSAIVLEYLQGLRKQVEMDVEVEVKVEVEVEEEVEGERVGGRDCGRRKAAMEIVVVAEGN